MHPILYFAVLLGGLFTVAAVLLEQFDWPRDQSRRRVLSAAIVIADLVGAIWLADHFATSSYELIVTTLAWCHFAFVCFWCVCSRGSSLTRIGLVGFVVAILFVFFPGQRAITIRQESVFLADLLRHRLVITCVAAWIAGTLCRLWGWRIAKADGQGDVDSSDRAPASRAWISVAALVLVVAPIVGLHFLVESQWTDTFDRDFSIAAISCLSATLMMATLAVTACRFRYSGLGIAVMILAVGWSLYVIEERWSDSFDDVSLKPGNWLQYAPWILLGTAWWWLIWKHLSGIGFVLQESGPSPLLRPQLKHLFVGIALACAIFASVKTRYFDQFGRLVEAEMRAVGGSVGLKRGDFIRPARVRSITFVNDGMPERVTSNLVRFAELRSIRFRNCALTPKIMAEVGKLIQLTELDLSGCDLSGISTSGFAALRNLERLTLSNTPLSQADFRAFAQLPNLKHIALSEPGQLTELTQSSNLETLDLTSCKKFDTLLLQGINTEPLRIVQFPEGVGWTTIPDGAKFPHLHTLTVQLGQLTKADIESIDRFPSLKRLEIVGCESGYSLLNSLSITELGLQSSEVTPDDLETVTSISGLHTLVCFGFMSAQQIQDNIPRITSAIKSLDSVHLELISAPPDDKRRATSRFDQQATNAFVPFVISGEEVVGLSISEGRSTIVSGLEISFDDFLTLLELGESCQAIHSTIRNGTRVVTEPKYGILMGGVNLAGLTDDELMRILDTNAPQETLSLIDPKLSQSSWERLSRIQLAQLVIKWQDRTGSIDQIIEVFADNPGFRLGLVGTKFTLDEQQAWLARVKCQLWFMPRDEIEYQ